MIKRAGGTFTVCLFFYLFFSCWSYAQDWPKGKVASLPDPCFASIEFDKKGRKVRHFPYRDIRGHVDTEQLIFCLGTFEKEHWISPVEKNKAKKLLEEHYRRFMAKHRKSLGRESVNINSAGLKDLVVLPNIGPVTAVRIYRFRRTNGSFTSIHGIKKVEGIGPSVFAGIRYYVSVH